MADFAQLQKIIREVENHPHVNDAIIISRSGNYVAGDIPRGAHMQTYVAMCAILLGAAESSTTGLQERLRYVLVQLEEGKMLLAPAGNRALLVLRTTDEADLEEIAELSKNYSELIENCI